MRHRAAETFKDLLCFLSGYLENGDFNYIVVNSERILAGPDYLTAAGNCLPIGRFSAKFIDFLVHMGLKLGKLHVIGMSLGGQIAGITGKYVRSGRIHRITGKLSFLLKSYDRKERENLYFLH